MALMKIGIDGTCWWNQRGFGRFTRELLPALLAGDAAGQVKPFSGGGIYTGLVAARHAAATISDENGRRTGDRRKLRLGSSLGSCRRFACCS